MKSTDRFQETLHAVGGSGAFQWRCGQPSTSALLRWSLVALFSALSWLCSGLTNLVRVHPLLDRADVIGYLDVEAKLQKQGTGKDKNGV